MKDLYRRLLHKIAATPFVRSSIEERADLSPFKEKPSLAVITGVVLIIIASLLGWPAVTLLGLIALELGEPLIAVIGGPLVYGLSHLVFLVGMYFSGAEYSVIFCRWLTRVIMERLLAWAGQQEV